MPDNIITYSKRHLLPDPDAVAVFHSIHRCSGVTMFYLLNKAGLKYIRFLRNNILDDTVRYGASKIYGGQDIAVMEKYINATKLYTFTWIREPVTRCLDMASHNSYTYPSLSGYSYSRNNYDLYLYNWPQNELIQQLGNAGCPTHC
jgi:hypothetical protein